MADDFAVRVSAGSRRAPDPTFVLPHAWTDGGVAVEGAGTGAHLFHAAVAVCVLNDVFREARAGGLAVDGVEVSARGGFTSEWASTGVVYDVEVDGVPEDELASLLARVDEVAEIPRAVRAGARVERDHG
jgi:uncharacterized OsmC-like protein